MAFEDSSPESEGKLTVMKPERRLRWLEWLGGYSDLVLISVASSLYLTGLCRKVRWTPLKPLERQAESSDNALKLALR